MRVQVPQRGTGQEEPGGRGGDPHARRAAHERSRRGAWRGTATAGGASPRQAPCIQRTTRTVSASAFATSSARGGGARRR
jgi:hypothetical protein